MVSYHAHTKLSNFREMSLLRIYLLCPFARCLTHKYIYKHEQQYYNFGISMYWSQSTCVGKYCPRGWEVLFGGLGSTNLSILNYAGKYAYWYSIQNTSGSHVRQGSLQIIYLRLPRHRMCKFCPIPILNWHCVVTASQESRSLPLSDYRTAGGLPRPPE